MIKTVSLLSSSLVLKYHFFSFQVILFTIYKTVSVVILSNTEGEIQLRFFFYIKTNDQLLLMKICVGQGQQGNIGFGGENNHQ